jgi:hypothetical protein
MWRNGADATGLCDGVPYRGRNASASPDSMDENQNVISRHYPFVDFDVAI